MKKVIVITNQNDYSNHSNYIKDDYNNLNNVSVVVAGYKGELPAISRGRRRESKEYRSI